MTEYHYYVGTIMMISVIADYFHITYQPLCVYVHRSTCVFACLLGILKSNGDRIRHNRAQRIIVILDALTTTTNYDSKQHKETSYIKVKRDQN